LLPLFILYLPGISFPNTKTRLLLFVILDSLIIAGFLSAWKVFPLGNILYNLGLGPKLLKDAYWGDNISPALPAWFWHGLQVMIIITMSLILMRLIGQFTYLKINLRKNDPNCLRLMQGVSLIISLGYLVFLVLNNQFFDRYTLPVTTCLLILFIPEKISLPVRRFVVPVSFY